MIEKQVAVVVGSILLLAVFGVGYTLVEPMLREQRAEHMTEVAAERGHQLFISSGCVECHLDNGYGVLQNGVGWPLNTTENRLGTETELENRRQLLFRVIARGRGPVMAAYLREEGGPLNEEQINSIVAFIQHGHWPAPPVEGEAAQLVQQAQAGTIGGGDAGVPGAGLGAQLFQSQGCIGCHRIGGSGGAIGPELTNIGTVAAERQPGTDAEAYILESIVEPNAFVVPGYTQGVMPGNYGQVMTPEELEALVQYLLEQQ